MYRVSQFIASVWHTAIILTYQSIPLRLWLHDSKCGSWPYIVLTQRYPARSQNTLVIYVSDNIHSIEGVIMEI